MMPNLSPIYREEEEVVDFVILCWAYCYLYGCYGMLVQSGRRDLNPRPLDPQSSTLNQAAPRPVIFAFPGIILLGLPSTYYIKNRKIPSGRLDLNQRPLRPERSALAKLSYAPAGGNRNICPIDTFKWRINHLTRIFLNAK